MHNIRSNIGRVLDEDDLLTCLVWVDRLDAGVDRVSLADCCEVLRRLLEERDDLRRRVGVLTRTTEDRP